MGFAARTESLLVVPKGQDEIQGRKESEMQAAEGNNLAEQCPVCFVEGELWAAVIVLSVGCLAFKCRYWESIIALFVCLFPSPCV